MSAATLERPANWINKMCKEPFIKREFPSGSGSKFILLTPQIATELLERNPDNRSISQVKVAQYASDIECGRWSVNGESIIVAADGSMNDGQHRCWAVIEAKTPITTMIVYGVDRDTRTTVDQGRGRGSAAYLAMRGVAYSSTVSAVAKMMVAYEKSFGSSIQVNAVTNAEAMAYVAKHEKKLCEVARRGALAPRSTCRLVSSSLLALWCYLLQNHGPIAEEYLEQILTGENLSSDDVAYKVRERLGSIGKGNRQPRTEAFLRGWIAHKNGKKLTAIRILGELPRGY